MNNQTRFRLCLTAALALLAHSSCWGMTPIVDETVVFAETDGMLAVEAEHFFKQTETDVRAFHPVSYTHLTLPTKA